MFQSVLKAMKRRRPACRKPAPPRQQPKDSKESDRNQPHSTSRATPQPTSADGTGP